MRPAVSMTVKALTFHIIGTVFDWLGSFSAKVAPLAQKYGLSIDQLAFANGAEQGHASGVQAAVLSAAIESRRILSGGSQAPPAANSSIRRCPALQRINVTVTYCLPQGPARRRVVSHRPTGQKPRRIPSSLEIVVSEIGFAGPRGKA